ncbi:MAG: rhodanese-like domain-containing protein [Pseudomonadota bacterium]
MTRLICAAIVAACFSATASFACYGQYTVRAGDTLSAIAAKKLGSIFRYTALYEINQNEIGANPDRLSVGQVLEIPCDPSGPSGIDWSVMPNPTVLADLTKIYDIQILDIRSERAVLAGVLPGTISIPYAEWRGPKDNPGQPPTESRLAELVGAAGLRLDQPIVIVHQKPTQMDSGRAAFVYWLLKSSGAEQIAILRDGYRGWIDAGLPISPEAVVLAEYEASVTFSRDWRADELDIYGVVTKQIPGQLLDARPHSMFERFDKLGAAIATTLPSAESAPVEPLLTFLSGRVEAEDGVNAIKAFFYEYGPAGASGPIISFCSSGELGALSWFYASELAGLDNVRLYPESVKGWADQGANLVPGHL